MENKLSVLRKEKEDLLNLLDEGFARQDEVRLSLFASISLCLPLYMTYQEG